jgi:hypothetical protein
MVSLRGSFKFEVSSVRQEGPGALRLRIGDCRLRIQGSRLRADAGDKMRKTNPIWPGPGRLAEGVVQNKPNSRIESCGTNPIWVRRGVNAQNEPNFPRQGKRSGGDAQPTIWSGASSAKSRSVQNEPKLGRDGTSRQGRPPALGASTLHRNLQNKPNLWAGHPSAKYLPDKRLRKTGDDSASAKTKPIGLWPDGRRVGGDCGR